MYFRPKAKSTSGIGSEIVKLISSASHDILRTERVWCHETVSVTWNFGDNVGEGCEAKRATHYMGTGIGRILYKVKN